MKVLPSPSLLSTLISPPMSCTISLIIAIPSPVPGTFSSEHSLAKGVNSLFFRKSSLMPMPVSCTVRMNIAFLVSPSIGSSVTYIVTVPPSRLYFRALDRMLEAMR